MKVKTLLMHLQDANLRSDVLEADIIISHAIAGEGVDFLQIDYVDTSCYDKNKPVPDEQWVVFLNVSPME